MFCPLVFLWIATDVNINGDEGFGAGWAFGLTVEASNLDNPYRWWWAFGLAVEVSNLEVFLSCLGLLLKLPIWITHNNTWWWAWFCWSLFFGFWEYYVHVLFYGLVSKWLTPDCGLVILGFHELNELLCQNIFFYYLILVVG